MRPPSRIACLLLLAALPCLLGVDSAGPPRIGTDGTLLIENTSLLTMEREEILRSRSVLIRDGRIERVGPSSDLKAPSGAIRIDGRGKVLMPGLVDMHIHLAPGMGAASEPVGRQLRLLLANGITTARALIPSPTALEVRERIARGEQIGPRLVVYSPSMNGGNVTTPEQASRLVEQYADQGYDGIKTHGGIPRPAYDAMVATAAKRGFRIAGHVTREVGLERALEARQQIEHLDGYLAALMREGTPAPEGQFVIEDAELAAIDEARIGTVVEATRAAGVVNGPTLALFSMLVSEERVDALAARPEMRYVPRAAIAGWSQQIAQFRDQKVPPANRRRFVALRARLVRELDAAGCPLMAGSDSPQLFMVPGFALHRELEALVAAGLRPYAALLAATYHPHRYLGDEERGTIAAGQRADLVLLEGNPLEDIRNAARVSGVMSGGRWYSGRELRKMLAEVESSARAVN